MPKPSSWPTDAEAYRLVADLLAGAATAPGEIFSAFLTPLTHSLRWRYRFADPEQCETAAADAVLAVVKRPTTGSRRRCGDCRRTTSGCGSRRP